MFEVEGELKFTTELRAGQLAYLKTFCTDDGLCLELNDTFSGLQWDGSECESLADEINQVTAYMRNSLPEFGLTGRLRIQDGTVWLVEIGDEGIAYRKDIEEGTFITCPHCHQSISLDSQKDAL